MKKIDALDPRVRLAVEAFLDDLDAEHIPFLLGDTRRTVSREWELWRIGRSIVEGRDRSEPKSWTVTGPIVTKVFPGSGTGPHFYGLAADVYPKNAEGGIMSPNDPAWDATITAMWRLAEERDLDALGHDDPTVERDALWSGDPCHYQAAEWRTLIASKEA
jgi:hypothetical protein